MAKKIKIEDIPERYNYAAVDSDGCAYAYIEKPELLEDSFDGDYDPLKKSLFPNSKTISYPMLTH